MREPESEATAFDERARERVRHGHVPDLRKVEPCDWFVNNVWRRPYLVDLVFGRNLRFALRHARGPRLLEVGCGMGHMTLEFARHGFETTGLDVSEASIDMARRFARGEPCTEAGALKYVAADFLSWSAPGRADTVCFFGALHHFADPGLVLDRVLDAIEPHGTLIVVEPARDGVRDQEAALVALIRVLLGQCDGWHASVALPDSVAAWASVIDDCLKEYREARDKGEAEQSPCDNASTGQAMLAALRARFREVECLPGYALFPRLGGGVRGPNEAETRRRVESLLAFEQVALQLGVLRPTEFLWAGTAD